MNKNSWTLVISLIALALVYVVIRYAVPRPLDWRFDLDRNSSKPFGLTILFQSLQDLFPDNPPETTDKSFSSFKANPLSDSSVTVFMVNDRSALTHFSMKKLMEFVSKGNSVFYCSRNIDTKLLDSLEIFQYSSANSNASRIRLHLHNFHFSPLDSVDYLSHYYSYFYIPLSKTIEIEQLGFANENCNFLKCKIGSGFLFLHSDPIPFTNYYLLRGNTIPYVEKVMAELPNQQVFWMEKSYNLNSEQKESLISIIGEKPSLLKSYLLFILLALIFTLTEFWRTQRVIPVVSELKNTSMVLVDSIARLYLRSNNNKSILQKVIRDFNHFVMQHYQINIQNADSESMIRLQLKSGYSESKMRELFRQLHFLKQQSSISDEELLKLYTLIEQFKKQKI
ncbi:MAG: hypothetical protein JXR34_03390 [Bacteroidales bacterium]|nr:hypothetical protein [Bacteroidales bacterium]